MYKISTEYYIFFAAIYVTDKCGIKRIVMCDFALKTFTCSI